MWTPTIHGDTIEDIYNSLEPPQIHHSFSETYPGFSFVAIFTIIHILLNYISYGYAQKFATKETNLKIPHDLKQYLHESDVINGTSESGYIKKRTFEALYKKLQGMPNSAANAQEIKAYKKEHRNYEKHVSKFQESLFKVIVFGFVYVYGIYVMFTEDFYWDAPFMWSRGIPQPMNNSLVFYYSIQLGYHGHRAVYQWFEYARPDFWAMFIHHWVATILIIGSWMLGYCQIGCVLLMSNDNTDLIMPFGKLFGYLGFKNIYNGCGILFLILWFPLRIFLYPYKVLYSCLRVDGGYYYIKTNGYAWFCVLLVFIIYALQFYWSKMVFRTMYNTFFTGKIVDQRSDTESKKQEKNDKKQKKQQ